MVLADLRHSIFSEYILLTLRPGPPFLASYYIMLSIPMSPPPHLSSLHGFLGLLTTITENIFTTFLALFEGPTVIR